MRTYFLSANSRKKTVMMHLFQDSRQLSTNLETFIIDFRAKKFEMK
jgi:hypothetical protein